VSVYPNAYNSKQVYLAPELKDFAHGQAEPLYDLPTSVVNVLSASQTLSVRQHLKLLPKACCTCPPCVKQENSFSVFAGVSEHSQAEFLRVDEVSDDWNRCCCTPHHPWKLEVRPYLPVPGDPNATDLAHFSADVQRDWSSFNAGRQAEAMRQAYMTQPPLFTIQRDDGQRCCRCPCKLLNTFVCCGCCQDGVHIYAGPVADPPDGELGRPYHPPMDRLLGSVKQPFLAGGLYPLWELRGEKKTDLDEPFAKVEGPYCFAGCSEFCFSYNFWVSKFNSPSKTGDVATITKVKPQSLSGTASMLLGDAQQYKISFNSQVPLTPAEKATIMANQLLIDYEFFDGTTEMCEIRDNVLYIYCCYSSCCGCLLPWTLPIPLSFG